jgi:hypothetical protein
MQVRTLAAGLAGACALAFATICSAQEDNGAASCAACGGCGGLILVLVALVVLNVMLLIWVARDAKARGMDSSVLWMLVVFFLGLLGLVIYLFARPQGITVPCPNCGNKRLQASVRCPHCGISS